MKGFFTSEPYDAGDWSGRNRQVHYMNIRPTYMAHPDMAPTITTEQLTESIPEFGWDKGHSGMELPEGLRERLDGLWEEYLKSIPQDIWDCERASRSEMPEAGIDNAVEIAAKAHADQKDLDGRPEVLHALAVGMKGKNDEAMIVGFLHDVLEDSEWTAGELRERGFSERIIDTLMLLTHDRSVP